MLCFWRYLNVLYRVWQVFWDTLLWPYVTRLTTFNLFSKKYIVSGLQNGVLTYGMAKFVGCSLIEAIKSWKYGKIGNFMNQKNKTIFPTRILCWFQKWHWFSKILIFSKNFASKSVYGFMFRLDFFIKNLAFNQVFIVSGFIRIG